MSKAVEQESTAACIQRGIALIGYRGTGKTTVGRIVAQRLGRQFIDADREIERRADTTIPTIFEQHGESGFRDLEEQTLVELCQNARGAVLATGGGSILRERCRAALAEFGTIVWLSSPTEIIVERLSKAPGARPALTSAGLLEEVGIVLEGREPIYRATADIIVDASRGTPEEVASEVIRACEEFARTKAEAKSR